MILVTGASGQLASQIVKRARQANLPVLTASRSVDADRQMDFDHPETLDFTGIKTVFLTSAGYAEDDVVMRRHGAVLNAARTQGVGHVIYTSQSKQSDHLAYALAHRWTEQKIRTSGLNWTILRNGIYAELIGALAAPSEGRITAPFGNGLISAAARSDFAEAALNVLSSPTQHSERCYELSGTTAFSISELAKQISASYEPISLSDERARLDGLGLLPFQPAMLMSIYSTAASGFLKAEQSDLLELVPNPRDALETAASVAQGTA